VRPLLSAELLKLRTTRTFVTLVSVTVVLSLIVVGLTAILTDRFTEESVREMFTFDFSALFILLLGVTGMAGEWRHRTITSSVLAAPDRLRLLAAKLIAYAVAGTVLSLIVTVALMAEGTLILSLRDETTLGGSDLVDILWRNLVIAALLGAFGVCVGGIVRNQIVAIVGLLVLSFVLEPTLLAVVPEVGKFGPTTGAPSGIIGISPVNDGGPPDEGILGTWPALAVMLGWVGLGFAATATLLRRRDLV
jgi:ABC-type transport system involved in multi-copper enzyme maturation permease subunit